MPIPNNSVLAALHAAKVSLQEQHAGAQQALQQAQANLDAAKCNFDSIEHQLAQITEFLDAVREQEPG